MVHLHYLECGSNACFGLNLTSIAVMASRMAVESACLCAGILLVLIPGWRRSADFQIGWFRILNRAGAVPGAPFIPAISGAHLKKSPCLRSLGNGFVL
jgi:hypothetical protein